MKPQHFWIGGSTWVSAVAALLIAAPVQGTELAASREPLAVTVAPAASGRHLVPLSWPFPAGWLAEGQALNQFYHPTAALKRRGKVEVVRT